MFYGFSGLPGAGKTLNAINFAVSEDIFLNRPMYYHRIPLFILDIDVCCSFSGWFYCWYLRDNSNAAILRKLKSIHNEDRFADIDDFPFLELQFNNANYIEIFMFWVRRLYTKERLVPLDDMLAIREITDNELTFDDIKLLNLHFTHVDNPANWVSLPKQSVFLADEIHHYWPVRTRDKLPAELEAISTHRHDGKDLIFVTQDWANTDIFLRRMMNHHTHFEFVGADKIACYKRKKFIDISNPFDKKACDKSIVSRPKHIYGAYFSTDLDTNNNKLGKGTKRALILGVCSLVFFLGAVIFGFPYAYNAIMVDSIDAVSDVSIGVDSGASMPTFKETKTDVYKASFEPMPWTAPIYSKSLKVVNYPDLMCFIKNDSCRCLTQQNTNYAIDDIYCRVIASDGVFNPYDKKLIESEGGIF